MKLIRLRKEDINEFNRLMQESFQFGYESVYGEDKELVLPLEDIMKSLNNPKCHSYEMLNDKNEIIGGVIVEINDNNINNLDFLFVKVGIQSKGIGQIIWQQIEEMYPNTILWKTCTPYFDKRNIHFYVNKLNFKIVKYFNDKHQDSNNPNDIYEEDDGMFEFEKEMNK